MAEASSQGKNTASHPQCSCKIVHRCSVSIKSRGSLVIKDDVSSGVVVSRKPSRATCTCNEVEYHKIQLKALRQLLVPYNTRDQYYHKIKSSYDTVIANARATMDVIHATISQLRNKDLERFRRASKILERGGRLPYHGKAIDEFRLFRAEVAIAEFSEASERSAGLLLSRAEAMLPRTRVSNQAVCIFPRELQDLVCNPYVPRFTDALSLLDVPAGSHSSRTGCLQPRAEMKPEPRQHVAAAKTPPAGPLQRAQLPIVKSTAQTIQTSSGYAFRGWSSAKVSIRFTPEGQDQVVCLDSGCAVSLVAKNWLSSLLPDERILKMASPVQLRGFTSSAKAETDTYISIPIFIAGTAKDGTTILASLCHREFHIVDDLPAQMLIGNDVIGPEEISIDISKKKASIGSCDVNFAIEPGKHSQCIGRSQAKKESFVEKPVYNAMLGKVEVINKRFKHAEIQLATYAHARRMELSKIQEADCEKLLRELDIHQKIQIGCEQFFKTDAGRARIRRLYHRSLSGTAYVPPVLDTEIIVSVRAEPYVFDSFVFMNGLAKKDFMQAAGSTLRSTGCLASRELLEMSRNLGASISKMMNRHVRDDAILWREQEARRV